MSDRRIELVARLTAACSAEIEQRDLLAVIPWPTIPTVAAMVAHLGGVHRWVTEVLRTQRAGTEEDFLGVSPECMPAWFEEGRAALLEALATVPSATPCWVIGGGVGSVAFWQRRMVFENAKHLIDLRASDESSWAAAPELEADDYADGIDELLTEFLPRSRRSLPLLPGVVVLQSADSARSWRIDPDWTVDSGAAAARVSATITASTSDLALMLWERADLLRADAQVEIYGSRAAVAALQATSLHPW